MMDAQMTFSIDEKSTTYTRSHSKGRGGRGERENFSAAHATSPEVWKALVEAFDLDSFKKLKDGPSRLPVDGTDSAVIVVTPNGAVRVVNCVDCNEGKLGDFYRLFEKLLYETKSKEKEDTAKDKLRVLRRETSFWGPGPSESLSITEQLTSFSWYLNAEKREALFATSPEVWGKFVELFDGEAFRKLKNGKRITKTGAMEVNLRLGTSDGYISFTNCQNCSEGKARGFFMLLEEQHAAAKSKAKPSK